ncbi:pentatricopeptide repeat-containing protein At1g31430 [Magnolia sinica]|uniref:pentatricopeptide repeat-containing protein At1g31430 n=1 Tax=Magnolia sinica TaxID=86752 RepID=UPI00265B640C|nr:pentatricopeptide repeat-containing protein At1g31430 [Magnolia sinica]
MFSRRYSAFSSITLQTLPKSRSLYSLLASKNPKKFSKKSCITLLKSCKSMKELKQIHCQIFRACLHQNRDTLDKLMAFCTAQEHLNLHYADKIFKTIQDPSLFSYNLMIRAFAKKGSMGNAVLLFDRLREHGLSTDNFTYPSVLKAVGCLNAISKGWEIHGFIVKSGLEFDSYVRNSLINMYAEMGHIEISRQLFDEMLQKDLVSWNVMIGGYVKCGLFKDAVNVFRQMGREGVGPDEATLVSTLSACASLGDLELGKKIHCCIMSGEVEFSTVLGNALLDVYSKCGRVDLARPLFDEMPMKNVISWTSIVSGYVNNGQVDEARELFDRSLVRDVILWTAMTNGYVQFSRFDEALALFREMQIRRVKPDKYTAVSVLTICAHLGALEQGKWIHGFIDESAIRIDAIVGTALIDMYAKCGCIEKSIEVFQRVEQKDTASWTAIICGLAMNGQTSKALEFFSEMKGIGAKPDDITFIGVLAACSHGGLVEEGRWYFDSMERVYQIEPKLEHYGCLVDLFGRAGLLDEAEELIHKIPNGNEKLPLWGALLAACRIHGNVEMSEHVAKHLVGIESCNSGIHTLLANIYAAADRWEDATRVRRKMKDLGVRKIPGCSSIEVNGVVHEFLVRDTSHPEIREIYCVLNSMFRILGLEENITDR